MRFVCEKCRTKYSIADEKVRKKVLKIRCKKCRNIIVVREPAAKAKAAAGGGKKKRDRLDDEFERAFDRLTGGNKKPEQPESGVMRRTDGGLEREFGEPTAGEEWFAILRGEQVGPMTLKELQASVQSGKILHGTYVWHDGMDDWVRAARCPDVRNYLPDKRKADKAGKPGEVKAQPAEEHAAEKKKPAEKSKPVEKKKQKAAESAPDPAAFDDETKLAAPVAALQVPEAAPADEPEGADVVPPHGRDRAAQTPAAEAPAEHDPAVDQPAADAPAADAPTADEAPVGDDGPADDADDETEEERWEREDRRAAGIRGMPPPMPEEDDEIIIAPAITGKLVTLRASLAMTLAASMVSIIGTAVVMALLEDPPPPPKIAEAVKKKVKRNKIVLTPELLALKSKLFGEDPLAAGGKRRHSRRSGRKGAASKAAGSGLVPAIEDSSGAAPAGLDAAFARVGAGLGEDRGTRGGGAAADGGPLAGVAVDSSGTGLPGVGRSGARASSGGYGSGAGRRSGADVSSSGGPLPDGLSGEVVASRFQGRSIESCYNRALKRDPGMKGKLIVSFEIGNSGRVKGLDISPRKFRGTFLAQCFSREIKKNSIPAISRGVDTDREPFILSAR